MILSETDFLLLTRATKFQLYAMVKGMSLPKALAFRRDIQVAIAGYRKLHNPHDPHLWRALDICGAIEKWGRLAFMPYTMKQLARTRPDLKTKIARKIEAKKQWEALLKRSSY